MPDMYDKLGEMLNEALESGEIPQNNENDQNISEQNVQNSGHFSFNNDEKIEEKQRKNTENTRKSGKNTSKKAIPTGEVIKMHNYAYNMHFPPYIQKALSTLDIVYPFTKKVLNSAYRKKLKETHPDTKNTIQTSQDVQYFRHYTIDEIKESYKILCIFFDI